MSILIAAGLLLAVPAYAPAPDADADAVAEPHRIRIDHRGQRVEVTYRSAVSVAHRQVGAAGAPGRPAALHCRWRASVDVHREARHAAGHMMTRTISSAAPITGSRPGWCATQRAAIARDVAARSGTVRDHLLAAAARDGDALVAELDTLHDAGRS